MKQILITLFLTAFCTGLIYHESYGQTFLRIYNNQGKKIGKGTIDYTTDSFIVLVNRKKIQDLFFVRGISYIKTRRSFGASIVKGSVVGMGISLGVANTSNTDWEGLGIGALIGTSAGALIGTISGMATKREKFIIRGSIEKWKPISQQLAPKSKKVF